MIKAEQPTHLSAADLTELLDFPGLIEAMEEAFSGSFSAAPRQQYNVASGRMLVMPAWNSSGYSGAKLVTIRPDNRSRGLPSIHGMYVLFSAESGAPVCTLDGGALTVMRTAATSAAAARRIAPEDASRLLVVGAGQLAPWLIRAHAAARRLTRVEIWNRDRESAGSLALRLQEEGLPVRAVDDLSAAVAAAEIVSTATSSHRPLLTDAMVRDDVHLDLVGAYRPEMAEASADWFRDAAVWVDTREGAMEEAGDLIQAQAARTWDWQKLRGDLRSLFAGERSPSRSAEPRTVFKSVGASEEDLSAALLAWERWQARK